MRSLFAGLLSLILFAAALAWQQSPAVPVASEVAPVPPLPVANSSPRYWKGNLHTHTLWSDGDDFPEMIADWYKRHGYHFLALTDHNILAQGERWVSADANATRGLALKKYTARFGPRWVETREKNGKAMVRLKPLAEFRTLLDEPGKFQLIPAEEITHRFAKRPIHINGVNLTSPIKPLDGKDAIETISVNLRQVADQRSKSGQVMIAFLNHPNFGWGVRAEELLMVQDLRYFEVFNGHSGVRNYGDATHTGTERVWDIANALRLGKHGLPMIYGMATDDAHGYHVMGLGKTNPGRGWVMVKTPHLTPESIVKGIEAGDFYASTGVTLDEIVRTGNDFRLRIRTEPGVEYKTQFIATLKNANLDGKPRRDQAGKPLDVTMTYSPDIGKVVAESSGATASYRITGNELYVRAKITSTKPHPNPYAKGDVEVAWTQPVAP